MTPPFKLRYTNKWREITYFSNLGGFWGPGDTRRLIERVTTNADFSKEFASVEDAREVLSMSGNQVATPDKDGVIIGWQIIDATGRAAK